MGGNCVMVAHGGGYVTLYGHLSEIGAGSVIGSLRSSGRSTGPMFMMSFVFRGKE
ncbi:M23 family metallopeptidase [Elizabethkingia miricola]|uniref:M23 family metallopeptidase n=1 Tax=Elizabethkingia miricola TaxID=172045 RepID=UPI003906642A